MQTLAIAIGIVIVAVIVMSIVAAKVAQTTFWRGFSIWLGQVFAAGLIAAALIYVVKPYLLEVFVVPTNSMAPTILGWHSNAACPHCGADAVLPRSEPPHVGDDASPPRPTACPSCGKFGKPGDKAPSALVGPDRILVNKLMKPERWDVVVFKSPDDPKQTFVDRVVGLPNETVYIEDGMIWVDGVKTPLPESIGKWTYTTTRENGEPAGKFGTKESPWKLGANEYCVLGDFGWLASDSRVWGPVPKENVIGVVTLRVWPTSRWAVIK